jgi:hypothetical protein
MSVYRPEDWMTEGEYVRSLVGRGPITDEAIGLYRVRLMRHILDSHMFFARNYGVTVDKQLARIVPFDPWFSQTGLDYTIEVQRRLGYAQRVIEIKPRQVGWTQLLLSRCVHTILHPNKNAVVFVPDMDVSRQMMGRMGMILNNLPAWLSPMRKISNAALVEFENPNAKDRPRNPGLGSALACIVPADFRGATNLNMVVLSEYAKYRRTGLDVAAFSDALFSGIAESVETCVVIDTTPMGHDDYYEPLVMDACERNPNWVKRWYCKERRTRQDVIAGYLGEPDRPDHWVPYFTRWTDHERYTTKDDHPRGELPALSEYQRKLLLQGTKGTERLGTVDRYGGDEELWLMREHHATLGNIWWRRYKIDHNTNPDWRNRLIAFRQEFAIDHDSCFVSYGRAPFDPRCMDVIAHQLRDPFAVGILRQDAHGRIYLDPDYRSQWEQVRLWSTPEPGEQYVIGVDIAHAFENPLADDSVAQVLRRRDLKQVCVYQAKVPPHRLVPQLYLLYRWYNDAFLAIETEDGIAYPIVRQLFDMGATNQYRYKRLDQELPEDTKWLGWETNPRTRGELQETLVRVISNVDEANNPQPLIVIRDRDTFRQLSSLERRPDGLICGSGKTKDDLAMALMIAVRAHYDPNAPYVPARVPRPRDDRPRADVLMDLYRERNSQQPSYACADSYVEPGVGAS